MYLLVKKAVWVTLQGVHKAMHDNSLKCIKNISPINSVPKVIEALEALDNGLTKVDLPNVQIFNYTYLVISRNVHRQIHLFEDKKTLEMLDIHFAHAYFRALNNYLRKKENPPAWKIFFDFYSENRSSNIFYLWLGANAHINNDLPFSLEKTVTGSFYRDYAKVQTVIDQSIKEILPKVTKNKFKQAVYLRIIKVVSRKWRKDAWNNSKSTGSIIQNKAGSYAERIVFMSKIIGL